MTRVAHYWTETETHYLIENYTGPESAGEIATRLGISKQQVARKARGLGFSKTENSRPKWSEEELSLLEAWAETMSLADLTKAWNRKAAKKQWPRRSPNALVKMIRKLGYTTKPLVGCYSARAVAAALGVSEWAVQAWIKSGGLKAKKQGEGEHSNYVIRDKDLAEFALCNPMKIARNITPESAEWLLDVIADSRKTARRYSISA